MHKFCAMELAAYVFKPYQNSAYVMPKMWFLERVVLVCYVFYCSRLPYPCLAGGVLSFHREHFQKVNGYSNIYWGWGAEDDDMYKR